MSLNNQRIILLKVLGCEARRSGRKVLHSARSVALSTKLHGVMSSKTVNRTLGCCSVLEQRTFENRDRRFTDEKEPPFFVLTEGSQI